MGNPNMQSESIEYNNPSRYAFMNSETCGFCHNSAWRERSAKTCDDFQEHALNVQQQSAAGLGPFGFGLMDMQVDQLRQPGTQKGAP